MPKPMACPHCGNQLTAADLDAARFDAFVSVSEDGCWEWSGGRTGSGYGVFTSGNAYALAHRWQYERHNGPIGKGLYVLHRCDNPPCVRPDHLWAGTPLDNMRDKNAKGRGRYLPSFLRGERHGRAKVTQAQVDQLRQERAAGATLVELGHRYGLAKSTVGRICRGESWRPE